MFVKSEDNLSLEFQDLAQSDSGETSENWEEAVQVVNTCLIASGFTQTIAQIVSSIQECESEPEAFPCRRSTTTSL
jgi:hypothetical protein